jgi:hypothetical protein
MTAGGMKFEAAPPWGVGGVGDAAMARVRGHRGVGVSWVSVYRRAFWRRQNTNETSCGPPQSIAVQFIQPLLEQSGRRKQRRIGLRLQASNSAWPNTGFQARTQCRPTAGSRSPSCFLIEART